MQIKRIDNKIHMELNVLNDLAYFRTVNKENE